MRSCSWLFTAKCLTEAPTPCDCRPRTSEAPSTPETSGSSEKYSKLRPHNGERLMLMPGPSTTPTWWASASRAIAAPIRPARSVSKVDPRVTAGGKQVAGTESASPRWSASPVCRRNPCGPSVMVTGGMPARSTPLVLQKFLPVTSRARSSTHRSAGA